LKPRGKTPSLLGGGAGASKMVTAKKKRTCKRCKESIPGNTDCVEVGVPGTMGSKTYCLKCFRQILRQTKEDLARLEAKVEHG
jgi:hypothetical protein